MYDLIVIGAGAAGLMAAGVAARDGNKVLVLEKMEKAARKVRITGKGRCNVTNTKPVDEFLAKVRANADFFDYAFREFDNQDTIDFFRENGVKLEIERGDRVFPSSGKAWDIANALVDWATESGAEIEYKTKVLEVLTLGKRVRGVRIETKNGFERKLEARNVIIATGGVSYPATGSTGDGYMFAHELGHRIEEVRPSLVPLESDWEVAQQLDGVMLKNVLVELVVDGETVAEEFGEMSFTSRGLEGAVILRLSRIAVDALIEERQVEVVIDLKSALSEKMLTDRIEREYLELEEEPDAVCGDLMRKLMPRAMIVPLAKLIGADANSPLSRMTDEMKLKLVATLKEFRVPISDYRSFEEAVVTAGGVDVENVDPQTMQSKLVDGLYFAGEVLDIDADTGGYNLQVAFSTGHLAGKLKK